MVFESLQHQAFFVKIHLLQDYQYHAATMESKVLPHLVSSIMHIIVISFSLGIFLLSSSQLAKELVLVWTMELLSHFLRGRSCIACTTFNVTYFDLISQEHTIRKGALVEVNVCFVIIMFLSLVSLWS